MGNQQSVTGHPVMIPPPVEVLLQHRSHYGKLTPKQRRDDTPISALYRMYAAVACGRPDAFRDEFEYFWSHPDFKVSGIIGTTPGAADWSVAGIFDPRDHDPGRFAIIAGITYMMAAVFNSRIEAGQSRGGGGGWKLWQRKGREEAPQWAKNAPALKEPLKIPDADGELPGDTGAEEVDPYLKEKNVLVKKLPVSSSSA